ncbi:hypothetical protein ABIF93_003510 [Bradyrhizobium japonicum]
MAGDARHRGVERRVHDGAAGGHRLELDQAKGLGIGDRRHDEDVGQAHQLNALAVVHRAEQADTVTEAELADQLLEPRPLGAFADDPDLELAVDGGADQDVKALVGHEPAAGEHEPAAIVHVVRLDLRPVVTRGVDAERHDVAFVEEFPQQRRVLDQRVV